LKIFPAAVQTSFRLEKPVSELIPYVEKLEYDIYGEIALPNTKVSTMLLFLYFQFFLGFCLGIRRDL